jgi:peptidoglycan glycosyltransferase
VVKSFKSDSYGRLMSEEESEFLTTLMTAVVESGTATKLKGQSYTAAGKTGSAEYNNVKGESHAWFTGFAPVEDPQVAVTIIVEGAGSGGDYAVPIARRIFDEYFRQEEAQ